MILGVARAGKSTLAQMLKRDYYPNANILHGDSIKNAIIRNKYCSFGLGEDDETDLCMQHIIAKAFEYQIKYSDTQDVNIFEGSEVSPSVLKEYFDLKTLRVVILGHGNRSAEDIYTLCRVYDNTDSWSYYISKDELMHNCRKWSNWDSILFRESEIYGVKYFDTYNQRKEKLIDICKVLTEV